MRRSSLPLFGVKVVDFGQYIAGPAVAMILADLGATVVHIDPPSGPLWDSPANATLNRNKLIVSIDLKSEEGVSQAHALIGKADIVVENFRPGVLSRLGIDFTAQRKTRPDLITVSIPGFASNDRLRREWRAFEAVIAATSGVFTDMGLSRVLMGINPSFSPLPLASAYGTMLAVSATVLALQARERSGIGDQIEVPLACAVMEGLAYNSINIDALPLRYKNRREREIDRRREAGLPMDLSYESSQELLNPFCRNYKCKDGRMFYVVCPSHKHHARRCLQLLGLYDELVAEGLTEEADTYRPIREWRSDVSLADYSVPKYWADKIAGRMKAIFLTRTAKEWERIFGKGRVPGAPQRWLQEWISDDHAECAGLMIELDDPVYGRMTQPGPVVWLEESGEAMLSAEPRKWVAFHQALAALLATPARPQAVRAAKASAGWLDGVRVLDMCNVIAGPHSSSYLARFGAEVIKIDPASPFYDCLFTVILGMTHMRGKRSILVDIGSSGGRKVFERLVKSVDVVVWNATDRQIKQWGLDLEGMKVLNQDAIFCQLDCFGGIRRGPRSDYLGYDDLVQATTGIMLRCGGSEDTPEQHAHIGTIDVMCGFGAALGIAVALYQKARTGRAGRSRTSLSALSGVLQIPFCYDFKRRGEFNEPAGIDVKGYDALTRLYQTASGSSLLLSAFEDDLARFVRVEGLERLADVPKEERDSFLVTTIGKVSAKEWLSRFIAADIGAAICENIAALLSANSRPADGTSGVEQGSYSFSIFRDHPSGHAVTQVDPYAVRSAVGKIYALSPAEKYGASTRQVLQWLQYSEAEIDALLATGAVSETWSREYLPG
ncbi:crotonobetainyl-CoA:carnitine CoA-transferase CaiB-like acyl-CoA transferase [Bradyrhizobium sp. USDA 4532]|uniref:CoA transferase n=1 Tax=unclassified Bradyrhizobium TaxID=2631580 RepID=UPI00209CC47A|nr:MULTISPECIES: CoA transferase [unclassified Bradyrhizobium]MCP1835638.1 crotonobetainyl-CoA:carnitine CoA-transferase CaiB-like acyl-CoA transferase [Bradyrhizobium sp. USDA 4545]MCP1920387.1 crotonobetainyl-CoA:carnitine CoA-transferase CaiB-like acyl-CoA transferase [Bradyrhizobium sp. USDA 4532]